MGGPTCLHWELKQQWPHKEDMLCARRWIDAGPAGRVRCWQVQCREPKTGYGKRFNSTYEDDPLCPSRYIIYLWASLIVPDFIISVYGSSWNSLVFWSQYLLFSFTIYFLASHTALGMLLNWKRNQRSEIETERETYMNCQTQNLLNLGLLESPLIPE